MGTIYSFGGLYLWNEMYNNSICRYGDALLIRGGANGEYYGYPNGRYDIREIIPVLQEDAHSRGLPLRFAVAEEYQRDELMASFPNSFTASEYRREFDYVYDIDDLALLAGRKYHGKRGHIAKFIREHPCWSSEPLTGANAEECREMELQWCSEYSGGDHDGIEFEKKAIMLALSELSALDLFGTVLRTDGRIVAFSIGERLNDTTVDVHFEKALASHREGYALINREFCAMYAGEYRWVNREEDMGDEGLRKAKLSYCPAMLVKKYTITER